MRIRTIVAAAFIAALGAAILGGGIAGAHQKAFNSNVKVFFGASSPEHPGQYIVGGVVKSKREPCRADRQARLIWVSGDGSRQVVDRGRSSANGVISLSGPIDGDAGEARIRVTKKRFGPTAGHRHVCKAGVGNFPLFFGPE